MEDSTDVNITPKKIKQSRWGPITENDSSIKKSDKGSGKVIPNGTGNGSSENVHEEVIVKEKPKTIKITKTQGLMMTALPAAENSAFVNKIVKSGKTEQIKERAKTSPVREEQSSVKTSTPCDSPTSSQSTDDGFQGFESLILSQKQSEKQDVLLRILDQLNDSRGASSSHDTSAEESLIKKESEIEKESGVDTEDNSQDKDMTVDTVQASDSDSDQMEIDMGDKDSLSKADSTEFGDKHGRGDRTKDSDVDIMETDSVKSGEEKIPRKNQKIDLKKTLVASDKVAESSILESTLKGSNVKVEYCGGCEAEVDDAEEGICCDGKCERWFHLRCSGLTQAEYDELGHDENAKWACNKCSGKPAPAIKADAKPLLSVRKDLTKIVTPPSGKRKSLIKEGSGRTPKIDISNPAFLKPFDFGWKRELVYRSTNDNHNRRQGDIYYYTPKGKKLRSLREISDHVAGSDLTPDNFTFWKEPLGIDDPEKEIIRDAKLKLVNKDPSTTPSGPKKVLTPKIPKTPKTTPKLTATVTPLDTSSGSPATTPKASASVTPRVVLKGKTSLAGTGPKFKVTPSKNTIPGQTQKIVISKGAEKTTLKENFTNNETVSKLQSYLDIIHDSRVPASVDKNGTVEDIEKNTRNKFRRYGLLANAKTPRKKVTKSRSSSSSSSGNSSDTIPEKNFEPIMPMVFPGRRSQGCNKSQRATSLTTIMEQNPGRKSKAICFDMKTNEKDKGRTNKRKTDSSVVHPVYKTTFSDKISLPLNPDRSFLQNPSKRRPSPPEIHFRPSNPSSYGCQTSSLMPHRSVGQNMSGPSSSHHSNMMNCESPFETVLIVDTTTSTETYLSPPKYKDTHYEPPLILNSNDCGIEIINVESLRSEQVNKYEGGYVVTSPRNRSLLQNAKRISPVVSLNDNRRNESICMSATEHSPVSLESSSTDEIVVVDEEVDYSRSPPILMRNSPPPKIVRHASSTNRSRSPPSLQPILPPPPLVPCPARAGSKPFLTSLITKQNITSQYSTQAHNNILETRKTGSSHVDFRKLKKERFYMRQKAKREMEKLKKSYTKEKELFVRRKSEEKRLRIEYLQLKVKIKELKMALVKKKLAKL